MRRTAAIPPELPGYEYVRLLGSGGFSDVFLYRQRLPRREVAVKVLLTEELNASSRNQFVAEANVMAQLSTHPYIVTIYHADVAGDERPFFVMEYCSGPSLADQYRRQRFEVADALRTGIRLAGAVATAHAAGFLHRDIKPANVLTNDFGWPALTDFGISSAIDGELLSHTTTTESLRAASETGTSGSASVGMSVPWSPPEMFGDDPDPDARSDIYSLAATIYTLLAGRTPFEAPGRSNGTLDIIGRIERGAITPLDRDDVPRSLVAVLRKGMAPRRDDRFATAIDFARALQRVELELGYAATSIEVPNLAVHPEDAVPGAEDDETRARSVATIEAEPTRLRGVPPVIEPSAPPATPPVAAGSPEPEQTVLRPKPAATPSVESPDVLTSASAAKKPSSSTTRRNLIVAAGAVVVLAIALTIALVLPHSSPKPSPGPGGGGSGGGITVAVVPDPTVVSVTRSGTSVTFVWKNPTPKSGDSYQWTREATNADPVSTTKPTAVVTDISQNASVCIDIVIVRAGRASPTPLKECTQ